MSTLYIRVNGRTVTDITNNKEGEEPIHLGVKYIHGKDNVTFYENDNGEMVVERMRGHDLLYKYTFREDGSYMLTPLFVTEYKVTSTAYRALYNFLKKNMNDSFLLEVDNNLKKPYEIVFNSWIDISFNFRFKVVINESILTKADMEELKMCLLNMKEFDLLELHKLIGEKSIYINKEAIDRLRTLPTVYIHNAW